MAPTSKKKQSTTDNQTRKDQDPPSHLLDGREIQIVEQLDPQVQENWRIQRSVRQSLLGYSILDLVERTSNLVFGTWNSRPLKSSHLKRLHESFKQEGLERFDERSVIPIVIEKSLVDLSCLTQDILDVKKIPQFKFTEGVEEGKTLIKCAGGRHRFEALKLYLQDVKEEIEAIEARRDQIRSISDDTLGSDDIAYFNQESIQELQRLGGFLQYGGQWLIAVYDETTLLAQGIELAQYLSRNERRHVYMETDEERVVMEIQFLATLSEDKRAQRLKEMRARNSSKKANPLVAVINSEPAFKATEFLVNRSSHFLDMPEMNLRWLYEHLCGVHGGVMCSAIVAMAQRLDLCLTDVVLKMEDVDELLKKPNDDKALQLQMKKLRDGRTVEALYKLLPEILDVIDDAWQGIQKPALDAIGCMVDYDYVSAYEQYVSEATDALLKYLEDPLVRTQVDASYHLIIDSFPAKFKLVSSDNTNPTHGLPLLTRSPIVALAHHFKRIPLTLAEVSRWFDPMVDYMVAFTKSWYSPSYTQAAIEAITRYDCLTKDCPGGALLLNVILNDYATALCLEVALPSYLTSHTQRVQTAKEMNHLFRSSLDKNSTQSQVVDGTKEKLSRRSRQLSQEETQMKACQALLQVQCDSLTKAMTVACKPREAVPLKHRLNRNIQGVNLLVHSSWNWQGISANSRSRDFHNIAGAAVLEFNIIAEYREDLIQSVPAASNLRCTLSTQFQTYMKKQPGMLVRRDGQPFVPPQFSFPDLISSPTTDESFLISDALTSWKLYQDKQSDRGMVQKMVLAVEKCPLAWQDPFNLDESKSPKMDPEVQVALEQLVLQLEKNAYRKRSGGSASDLEAEEGQDLGITFRGCEVKTLLPRGKRALRPSILKNIPRVSDKTPVILEEEDFGLQIDEDLAAQTTSEGTADPQVTLVKTRPLTQETRISLSPIPESGGSQPENPYPPAQRPAASPTPISPHTSISPTSTPEPSAFETAQLTSGERKRLRGSGNVNQSLENIHVTDMTPIPGTDHERSKKRSRGTTRFAQS